MWQRKGTMLIKDKRITVVGLARSGAGAARLLSFLGAEVTVTDRRPQAELSDMVHTLGPSVKYALGGHPREVFSGADLIVVSPGVPLDNAPLVSARAKGIPIIGELELAFRIINEQMPGKEGRGVPFLAVTGSNGKSTTTTLLDHMMKKAGFSTLFGGNIGNALTEEILKAGGPEEAFVKGNEDHLSFSVHPPPDFVVAEVSSFQLEAIQTFRPRVASLLNITPDHMDRYHTMTEYRNAKARIFVNQQRDDFLVLNADDPGTLELYELQFGAAKPERPTVCFFSRRRAVEGLYARDGGVFYSLPGDSSAVHLIAADEIRIRGVHNLENAMAASAMALLAGCPPEAVRASLREFGGLEHRLELVRELDGVTYINDSKGTNVGAVVKSIESFPGPLILIAGGRDKAGDFSVLRELVTQKVREVILIGEAAGTIQDALKDVTETVMAKDLAGAVAIARRHAQNGDVVLLSPACASFDMFRDFEDRGRQFKQIVMEMKSRNG